MNELVNADEGSQTLLYSGYGKAHCARMLFVRFKDPVHARAWLQRIRPAIPFGRENQRDVPVHIALTHKGVAMLGANERTLAAFPSAFRQGMAKRSSRLGDPEQPRDKQLAVGTPHCEPSAQQPWCPTCRPVGPLHAVLTVHAQVESGLKEALIELGRSVREDTPSGKVLLPSADLRQRLRAKLDASCADLVPRDDPGVEQLAYQDLHRPLVVDGEKEYGTEYFGFREGVRQPIDGDRKPLSAHLTVQSHEPLIDGGSFLVIRQLQQNVARFWQQMETTREQTEATRKQTEATRKQIEATAQNEVAREQPEANREAVYPGQTPVSIAERVMGITRAGQVLPPTEPPTGCPYHSHVSRVSPHPDLPLDRNPRMIRRGMSYVDEHDQRGLMFMALVGDIETQFEFVQRNWIQRGNHVGATSNDRDVIASGGAPVGKSDSKSVFSCPIEGSTLVASFDPVVTLVWGEYLFAPSKSGLDQLILGQGGAAPAVVPPRSPNPARHPASVREVKATMSALAESRDAAAGKPDEQRQIDERERALIRSWLDYPGTASEFWRFVESNGGYRVSGNKRATDAAARNAWVFVAHPQDAFDVMSDDGSTFSVSEYDRRMQPTTGEFFLGMDANTQRYQHETRTEAIIPTDAREVRQRATEATKKYLSLWESRILVQRLSKPDEKARFLLPELLAFVLDRVSTHYWGIRGPSSTSFVQWGKDTATYHFRVAADDKDAARARHSIPSYRAHIDRSIKEALAARPKVPKLRRNDDDVLEARFQRERLRATLSTLQVALGKHASEDDLARNLLGILTGSLGATLKLFSMGILAYAAEHTHSGVLAWPEEPEENPVHGQSLYSQVIANPLAAIRRGGPDSLYRQYKGKQPRRCRRMYEDGELRTGVEIKHNDIVVAWLGGGLQSPVTGGARFLFGAGPHMCPGMAMAQGLIDGVLSCLSSLKVKVYPENEEVWVEQI